MHNIPYVSIICPVYNVDKYIRKCIESFLIQTLRNWELILVDDGSSDSSGIICDNYAQRDCRIKVIHKKNGGVSSARQAGLDVAIGEYVIHADPDDWVERNMLEELYAKAKEDDADMVICDYYVEDQNTVLYKKQRPTSLRPQVVLEELFENLHGCCWNKLVKRSCCLKYNARFPVGVNYSEDTCFNVQLLKNDIKVSYLNKSFYHYVQTPGSITVNFTRKTLEMCERYIDTLCTLLPAESKMVLSSKSIIKYRAFSSKILTDIELKQLYPEIRLYKGKRIDRAIITFIAYSGHQNIARIIFDACKKILVYYKFR